MFIHRSGPRSLSLSVVEAAAARFESILVLDADLSHDPDQLRDIVGPVLDGSADVCVGSRYLAEGRVAGRGLWRSLLSRIGTSAARRLAPIRDPLSGYFACRKDLLDGTRVRLRPRGYKVLLEILVRCRGLRVREIPIRFQDRFLGESKLGLRQQIEFVWQLLDLSLHGSRSVAETRRRESARAMVHAHRTNRQ